MRPADAAERDAVLEMIFEALDEALTERLELVAVGLDPDRVRPVALLGPCRCGLTGDCR